MKIYLSGPMSGYEDDNKPHFHEIAAQLRAKGYEVVSPAEIEVASGEYLDYLRAGIKAMMDCDTIALLNGWQKSGGVGLELVNASALQFDIVDAYTLEPIYIKTEVDIKEMDYESVS